jgi:hypothetical protein
MGACSCHLCQYPGKGLEVAECPRYGLPAIPPPGCLRQFPFVLVLRFL